jgi:hypothetical protein
MHVQPGEVRPYIDIASHDLAISTAALAGSSCSKCAIEGPLGKVVPLAAE